MFKDRLEGTRIFGRIRSLDMECPQCGRVYILTQRSGHAAVYNRRTGLFHCQDCGLHLALGVLMYPVTAGRPANLQIPYDWTPTPRQAAALRQDIAHAAIYTTAPAPKVAGTALRQRNVALRPECRCQPQQTGQTTLRHPACPVHAAGALAPDPLAPNTGQPAKPRHRFSKGASVSQGEGEDLDEAASSGQDPEQG